MKSAQILPRMTETLLFIAPPLRSSAHPLSIPSRSFVAPRYTPRSCPSNSVNFVHSTPHQSAAIVGGWSRLRIHRRGPILSQARPNYGSSANHISKAEGSCTVQ
ncbi:unnamed protein product, partial [Ectocarpus sp. 4 AP-2014]